MLRFMVAPAVKRALVFVVVTGIVTGCSGANQTAAPSPAPQSRPPQPTATLDGTPLPSFWLGLSAGPYVLTGSTALMQVTVDIVSPGWDHHSFGEISYINKNDDGLDPPESVAMTIAPSTFPAGAEFNVYGDPCGSNATAAPSFVTTPDEIAAALAAYAGSEASPPVEITVGGFAGKAMTFIGPMTSACEDYFAAGVATDDFDLPLGSTGSIDELAILDVDGSIVILHAFYTQATPADLVEEMRALVRSATFKMP